MVVDAGTRHGCLPLRRPAALEGRHQGKAAFIDEYERGQQLTPLILPLARPDDSSSQSFRRRAGWPAAEPSESSIPSGSASARHRWSHLALGTESKLHARSGPNSSNLHYSHEHRHPAEFFLQLLELRFRQVGRPPWRSFTFFPGVLTLSSPTFHTALTHTQLSGNFFHRTALFEQFKRLGASLSQLLTCAIGSHNPVMTPNSFHRHYFVKVQ